MIIRLEDHRCGAWKQFCWFCAVVLVLVVEGAAVEAAAVEGDRSLPTAKRTHPKSVIQRNEHKTLGSMPLNEPFLTCRKAAPKGNNELDENHERQHTRPVIQVSHSSRSQFASQPFQHL